MNEMLDLSASQRRSAPIERMLDTGLYLVTDDRLALSHLLEKTEAALVAGLDVVQYRDKDRPVREVLERGAAVRDLCRAHGALFLVNDRLDLALALEADGLHLGQDDLPVEIAQRLAPSNWLLGLSAHSLEQSRLASELAVDYLGIGAMYPTSTKADAQYRGVDLLRSLRSEIRLPIVAIGGITLERVAEVVTAGADAIAVVSGIYAAPDSGSETRRFLDAIARARRQR